MLDAALSVIAVYLVCLDHQAHAMSQDYSSFQHITLFKHPVLRSMLPHVSCVSVSISYCTVGAWPLYSAHGSCDVHHQFSFSFCILSRSKHTSSSNIFFWSRMSARHALHGDAICRCPCKYSLDPLIFVARSKYHTRPLWVFRCLSRT